LLYTTTFGTVSDFVQ